MKIKGLGLALFALCLLMAVPQQGLAGTKEEIIRLQNDVLQLQKTIATLQRSADQHSAILKSLLEQLNDQIADTNVRMEDLVRAIRDQKQDSDKALAEVKKEILGLGLKWDDTNTRIAALQQQMQENEMQVQTLRKPPAGGGAIQADQVYQAVYNDYLMGNYDLAIAGFQDFLANYPDSEYSDNASYYLGVCYSERRRYEQAIQAFDQVINLYPKADLTPPAYYKKALVLQSLQRNAEAIQTLRRLVAIFPESQDAAMAKQELTKLGVESTESN